MADVSRRRVESDQRKAKEVERAKQFNRCAEIEQSYRAATPEEQQPMVDELDQMTLTAASKVAEGIRENLG